MMMPKALRGCTAPRTSLCDGAMGPSAVVRERVCRKQELVFIGMGLNEKKLRAALDGCLCTAWELVEGVDSAKDPFAAWPPIVSMLPAVEEEEEDGEGSDEEMSSSTDEESKSEAGDTAALEE